MPINAMTSRQEATNFLQECAKFAYGSGVFEGRSGGAGNIGMLGGRVVKFRTHSSERKENVTKEMADSCADLRDNLLKSFQTLLSRGGELGEAERNTLNTLKNELGIAKFDAGGSKDVQVKSLLDRKVVAKVIGKFEELTGTRIFDNAIGANAPASSKGVDTTFTSVKTRELHRQFNDFGRQMRTLADSIKADVRVFDGQANSRLAPDVAKALKGLADTFLRPELVSMGGFKFGTGGRVSFEKWHATITSWREDHLKSLDEDPQKVFDSKAMPTHVDCLKTLVNFAGAEQMENGGSLDAFIDGANALRHKLEALGNLGESVDAAKV